MRSSSSNDLFKCPTCGQPVSIDAVQCTLEAGGGKRIPVLFSDAVAYHSKRVGINGLEEHWKVERDGEVVFDGPARRVD